MSRDLTGELSILFPASLTGSFQTARLLSSPAKPAGQTSLIGGLLEPMAKDFYATLGVNKGSSDKEIRSAYRRLARKLHPDVNPNDKASEAQFKEINAAYDGLSDEDKRKKKDKNGETW